MNVGKELRLASHFIMVIILIKELSIIIYCLPNLIERFIEAH